MKNLIASESLPRRFSNQYNDITRKNLENFIKETGWSYKMKNIPHFFFFLPFMEKKI